MLLDDGSLRAFGSDTFGALSLIDLGGDLTVYPVDSSGNLLYGATNDQRVSSRALSKMLDACPQIESYA